MKRRLAAIFLTMLIYAGASAQDSDGWYVLLDGKSMDGWKVGQNAETFSIDSGALVIHGKTAHLFYDGEVKNHDFKNFHFIATLKTMPGANSGIYFHSKYQERGWPTVGYEVQVNNSQSDWRRTGSLYAIQDVRDVYVKDGEWFTEEIIVQGKHVIVKINGKTVVDYTEPEDVEASGRKDKRRIASGTFALQGHDPNSRVLFKEIKVKPLPD